jgi:hypothetical protein
MLRFAGPPAAGQRGDLPLPQPAYRGLMAAKCLLSGGGAGWPLLEQCADSGARPGMPPVGTLVTVRGRAGHLLDSGQQPRPPAGSETSWRALWWAQGNTIVILASQRVLPGDRPPLQAAALVALAGSLSCQRPAACR